MKNFLKNTWKKISWELVFFAMVITFGGQWIAEKELRMQITIAFALGFCIGMILMILAIKGGKDAIEKLDSERLQK